MPRNKHGGGANTNYHGLAFEQETNLEEALENAGYDVDGNKVIWGREVIAISAGKNRLYKDFLEPNGIYYRDFISKKLLPDEALVNFYNQTVYIIEKKFQHAPGSVDEKLQTCDFKKKQYQKLLSRANIDVEYVYLLSDWFRKPEYKDVLDYIISVRCQYYFEYIPLKKLGLPVPGED